MHLFQKDLSMVTKMLCCEKAVAQRNSNSRRWLLIGKGVVIISGLPACQHWQAIDVWSSRGWDGPGECGRSGARESAMNTNTYLRIHAVDVERQVKGGLCAISPSSRNAESLQSKTHHSPNPQPVDILSMTRHTQPSSLEPTQNKRNTWLTVLNHL